MIFYEYLSVWVDYRTESVSVTEKLNKELRSLEKAHTAKVVRLIPYKNCNEYKVEGLVELKK